MKQNHKEHILFAKKMFLYILSCACISVGISIFVNNGWGSDPISVWLDGLHHSLSISLGNASTLNTFGTIVVALFIARKYFGVGTLMGIFFIGPILNIVDGSIQEMVFFSDSWIWKTAMLCLGETIICIGAGLSIATQFGCAAIDCILLSITDKTKIKYQYLKIIADILYTLFGFLLGGVIGIGSIFSAIVTGAMIAYFRKVFEKTIIKWWKIS